MTKNTIDPVVSTDPALTAELSQQIGEWQAALKKWQVDLKALGNQAGRKADRKALKDRIVICETTIEGLRARLPATYVSPELARLAVLAEVRALDKLEQAKADFLETFTTNPASAIEWRAGKVVAAQTTAVYASRLEKVLGELAIGALMYGALALLAMMLGLTLLVADVDPRTEEQKSRAVIGLILLAVGAAATLLLADVAVKVGGLL